VNKAAAELFISKYLRLEQKWNDLVKRFNVQQQPQQFTQEELAKLIQLCHPDKHDGKASATEMTQKLLRMRGQK
jgi:hypothetical protein